MKCPKCGSLGFEHAERCRNCGYDFSLAPAAPEPELPMRAAEDPAPLDDLALADGGPRGRTPKSTELPLFSGGPDDEPLITRVSAPRTPLAVRRASPEVPRVRAEQPRAATFDLSLDAENGESLEPSMGRAARAERGPWAEASSDAAESADAGVIARFFAVVIDLVILAVTDAAVVYLTMQICGVSFAEIGIIPKGPLVAFLLVQNGGYLIAFTAGGQTLGKMATGIRVVPDGPEETLDLGRAFLRTMMWVLLAVPAGLGFLTAVFSRDHRGLHDRFAGTRVVR